MTISNFPSKSFQFLQMESQPKEWKDTKVAAQQPVEWKKLDLGINRTSSDCCLDGNFKTNLYLISSD